jgi:hypothetical protein
VFTGTFQRQREGASLTGALFKHNGPAQFRQMAGGGALKRCQQPVRKQRQKDLINFCKNARDATTCVLHAARKPTVAILQIVCVASASLKGSRDDEQTQASLGESFLRSLTGRCDGERPLSPHKGASRHSSRRMKKMKKRWWSQIKPPI